MGALGQEDERRPHISLKWNINLSDLHGQVLGAPHRSLRVSDHSQANGHPIGTIRGTVNRDAGINDSFVVSAFQVTHLNQAILHT